MEIVENFIELVDIEEIIFTDEYVNMVDISVDVDQSFMLANGLVSHNSAKNSFFKYRDPETMGAFALRGKILNVSEITNQKLSQNNELINLMATLGLKIGQKIKKEELRYGKIYFYTDMDHDGDAIASLLMNFFYRYWPELFDYNMIYRVETPILVATPLKSKNKSKVSFYSNEEYDEWCIKNNTKDYEISYKKGLAALLDDEYEEIIRNPKLMLLSKDDNSELSLDIWFGKDTEKRKILLLDS